MSGYIDNISEKQVEEMINLKILDFIINFLRRDIKESDIIFALHKEIERASEEERKEIFNIITKIKSFIEKMNTEFGYNYLSQVSKSVKQQSLQDAYKVEIIYILYLVHIIWRYEKLKDHYIHWGKTDGAMDKVIKNNKMHKKAGSKKIFEEVVDIF